jgi:hypothetical protein
MGSISIDPKKSILVRSEPTAFSHGQGHYRTY